MQGTVGNLSAEQDAALQQMLELFPTEEKDQMLVDDYHSVLLRFLRARRFNVSNAAQMYRDTLAWRKEVGADDILSDPEIAIRLDPKFHEIISHSFHKFDKRGRPVYYERTGAINITELSSEFTPEQMIRRHIWYMENQVSRMRESPKSIWKGGSERVEQMVHILDLKGLSLNPVTHMSIVNVFKETTRIDQTYYPELMGKMILFRAPPLFYNLWKWVSPLLDPVTQEKIVILGDDYEDALREIIDEDSLPVEFGGSCSSCAKGCVPVHFNKEVNISAGGKHEEKVELGPQGSTVSWSFRTASHDISFAVIHHQPSGQKLTLSPPVRHKNGTLNGSVSVEQGGTVSLVFDNSYSYMTSKTVKYRVEVEHQ
eukprot:TRINITY_DN11934_c0_g1_i1.p1 TRINITY_DN11934_c0_g1~~TRINITY_DN11934_c0_g1_i1.p1  ORF type:complete len:370 (-),score=60.33 TRINITY_DN11934_c0_g1_i1:50-1159(-)